VESFVCSGVFNILPILCDDVKLCYFISNCITTAVSIVCVCSAELNPMPTKEMVTQYNDLRQDIVLLYELKLALANCQYELQTLRHRYETLAADRVCELLLHSFISFIEAFHTLFRFRAGQR